MQGFKVPGGNGLLRHAQPMVGNANVADVSLFLHLQRRSKSPVRVADVRELRRIVELEEIDVVCPQAAEALLHVGQSRLPIRSGALGGDHHISPHVMESLSQFFLTVGVHIGGVEIVDTALIGSANQFHSAGLGDALNRQCAKGRFGDVQLRAAQPDLFHISPPALSPY